MDYANAGSFKIIEGGVFEIRVPSTELHVKFKKPRTNTPDVDDIFLAVSGWSLGGPNSPERLELVAHKPKKDGFYIRVDSVVGATVVLVRGFWLLTEPVE